MKTSTVHRDDDLDREGASDALVVTGLGKRYRTDWALRDCSFQLPSGSVTALIGANGAGKTTLLRILCGLTDPTVGQVLVFGTPVSQRREILAEVGFVAQDKPLYHYLTVAETMQYGAAANPRWDGATAALWLERFAVPLGKKVGRLSGGQRAQVAIAVGLAKRSRLLLLDEPLANLDPLARDEAMRGLTQAAADTGTSVVVSSHVVADLEQVCDRVLLLSEGRIRASADLEELLAGHARLVGPAAAYDGSGNAGPHTVVQEQTTDRQANLLVRLVGPVDDPRFAVKPVRLEELILAYLRAPGRPPVGSPDSDSHARSAS